MSKKGVWHVCELPVWEYSYYWDTLSYICDHQIIDLEELPRELQKYEKEAIKKVLTYAEDNDKEVKRITKTKWKWNRG